jgi:hypothetical protein
MGNPLQHTYEQAADGEKWPGSVQEAVALLLKMLNQSEKDRIAAMPEGDLIDLLGNDALLADCQRATNLEGRAYAVEGGGVTNPDDAAMLLIRALWARLRH